ncbi:unnamed protein product [Nezara viridula]|uniref:Uncharacterized protein n=1 Tax=Nezara viridula TaxID=85310 RepID=A0A9P0ED70_NEZVI|nr:unnamed protein product [Nezara viridula]
MPSSERNREQCSAEEPNIQGREEMMPLSKAGTDSYALDAVSKSAGHIVMNPISVEQRANLLRETGLYELSENDFRQMNVPLNPERFPQQKRGDEEMKSCPSYLTPSNHGPIQDSDPDNGDEIPYKIRRKDQER